VKLKLKSRRVRSLDELLALEEKRPAVCGPSPAAYAARHGLKLSKSYVEFLQRGRSNGKRGVALTPRKLVAA